MSFLRQLGSVYARIGRTYFSWSPTLMALAVLVFVPVGAIDAVHTTAGFEDADLENVLGAAALLALVGALVATSLVGEVFYSGVIATTLTHPDDRPQPSLRQVAAEISYWRLIVVDLVYVVLVVVGLAAFVVPGVLLFVFLGLAGPVIEIEKLGVRASLRRSFDLVRGHFWLVFWVFAPIEIVGDALGEWIGQLVHGLVGAGYFGTWIGEAAVGIVLSPFFAIAAVLLTVDLIAARDGSGPRLRQSPSARRAPVTA